PTAKVPASADSAVKTSEGAPASAPTFAPPTSGTRRPSTVAPNQIPHVPPPPAPVTRSKPEGIVRPPELVQATVEIWGRWRQVEGGNRADFLPGGYVNSTLVFRYDGLVEVRRSFGKDEVIQQVWRIGYEWNKDRSTLTLGSDPKSRPPPESLKGFAVADATVEGAVRALPAALSCSRLDEGRIRIGDKVYAPITEPPAPVSSDK
ncbi:MAG TPA: hypothetical protein VNA25_17970, partial [Phycisphaerae bacterium]|nr:hypothetical protein [Phycisphaerae bacterium]